MNLGWWVDCQKLNRKSNSSTNNQGNDKQIIIYTKCCQHLDQQIHQIIKNKCIISFWNIGCYQMKICRELLMSFYFLTKEWKLGNTSWTKCNMREVDQLLLQLQHKTWEKRREKELPILLLSKWNVKKTMPYLDIPVLINQQIWWLQIPVNNCW